MSRRVSLSILDQVRIATPCKASWEGMVGDDRVRHCGRCDLNVYNVAAMTREEAERLIVAREGRLCMRVYQRADGTILTADCPVGLAAVRAKVAKAVLRVAAAVATLYAAVTLTRSRAESNVALEGVQPFATLTEWVRPGGVKPQGGRFLAGDICVPAPANSNGN